MADPLTALMYAVQVMNFLKTLILKTLKEREDGVVEPCPARRLEPSDENGHESPSQTACAEQDSEEPAATCEAMPSLRDQRNVAADDEEERVDIGKSKASGSSLKKGIAKHEAVMMIGQKAKGISKLSRVESRMELIEAWR